MMVPTPTSSTDTNVDLFLFFSFLLLSCLSSSEQANICMYYYYYNYYVYLVVYDSRRHRGWGDEFRRADWRARSARGGGARVHRVSNSSADHSGESAFITGAATRPQVCILVLSHQRAMHCHWHAVSRTMVIVTIVLDSGSLLGFSLFLSVFSCLLFACCAYASVECACRCVCGVCVRVYVTRAWYVQCRISFTKWMPIKAATLSFPFSSYRWSIYIYIEAGRKNTAIPDPPIVYI